MTQAYGVVVIGRNEGQRLIDCLGSLGSNSVVYVDSGSTDDSVAQSRQLGVDVVQLDMSMPFTAARARNVGMAALLSRYPELEFVQFVDGDCRVNREWLHYAQQKLEQGMTLAAVCGRRREINRNASIYNLLCDIEWDTPVGEADACGGDAMYRVKALREVGGFNEEFIAGEEPELCYRLRAAGWRIMRIDHEMTQHDAAMHSFRQWWKRCQRSGYAYALGALEHGDDSAEPYKMKSCFSVLLWGGFVPLCGAMFAVIEPATAVIGLFAAYAYLWSKIYRRSHKRHSEFSRKDIVIYAGFVVLQKFPELVGLLQCGWQYMMGRKASIIEYK